MTDQSCFDKNLSDLKTSSPRMWEEVAACADTHSTLSVRVAPTEAGVPTLEAVRGGARCLLHSARDPLGEARRLVQSHIDGSEEIVVIVGFGLGYHVEEVLAKNKECRVLVIEPSSPIFRLALDARALTTVLGSARVAVIPYSENWMASEEASALSTLPGAKMLVHRPYRTLFPFEVGTVETDFSSLKSTREINLATLKRFDRLWTKNTFKNAPSFFALRGIGELGNSLAGLPAVVVSAGPSVAEDLASLSALREHAVIIAVDSALRPLLRRGIVPDFAVTVDPQLVNSLSVGDLADKTPSSSKTSRGGDLPVLVADPAVCPVTLRTYPGQVLLTSSVFSPGKVIEKYSGEKGPIAAGGSVSVAAFDLARILGSDPIILLGLDFSYETVRTHLSGSFIEAYIQSKLNRFTPAPALYLAPIMSGRPLLVRDKKGKAVLTDRRMLLYRSWFERHAGSSKARIFNATPRGLGIEGVPDEPLGELARSILGRAPQKRDRSKAERIAELRALLGGKNPDRRGAERLLDSLSRTLENLSRIEALGASAKMISEGLLGGTRDPNQAGAELGRLDREILTFGEEHRLLNMVMQGSIQSAVSIGAGKAGTGSEADLTGADAAGREETAYGSSLELYSSLEESARFLALVLRCSKKKLKNFLARTDNADRNML